MNKKRELVLQRLSRIGSLTTVESAPQSRKFRGKPPGTLSIEAAIDAYYKGREENNPVSVGQVFVYCMMDIKITTQKFDETSENKRYRKNAGQGIQTAYDRLDANRCAGFLLYSYDKYGVHSVLGEQISPGSYGGRITSGDFITKA